MYNGRILRVAAARWSSSGNLPRSEEVGLHTVEIEGRGPVARHAVGLVATVGLAARWSRTDTDVLFEPDRAGDPDPVLDWATSGAMALGGWPEGPPVAAPASLATAARGAATALAALAPELSSLDGPALLGERAALLGLSRRGRVAPGGGCRLLRCADGWIALNLARPDDWELLPAWLGEGRIDDPWGFAEERLSGLPLDAVVARGRLLGLPVSPAANPVALPPVPIRVAARGRARTGGTPLVVDLSSLWAGPLCAQLLGHAGGRVIRVESLQRPDGARASDPGFFHLLHAGQESVALDLRGSAGRSALRRLLQAADVVIEASRPRALAQLGIDAAALVGERPGKVWLSITGHGREEPGAQWVAFGDDAGAAAGLAQVTGCAAGERAPLFCGDAVADPLAGLYGAVAVLAARRLGGGLLLDVALARVAAHALHAARTGASRTVPDGNGWRVETAGGSARVASPRARPVLGRARPFGADTESVLRELARGC